PDTSFGFFDEVDFEGKKVGVMGDVQDMAYDQPKAERSDWAGQIREFVLHYFMRITDFREPEAYAESGTTGSPFPWPINWCAKQEPRVGGFGYEQLFYKLASTGEIGKFAEEDRFAIIDLREIGQKYEWVLGKVRIFNFILQFAPWGLDLPYLEIPLHEETFVILNREFIVDEDKP